MKSACAVLCLMLLGAALASDSNSNQNFNGMWFGWNGMNNNNNNNNWNGFNNNNNGWYGGMVGVPMVMAAPMPMVGGGPVGAGFDDPPNSKALDDMMYYTAHVPLAEMYVTADDGTPHVGGVMLMARDSSGGGDSSPNAVALLVKMDDHIGVVTNGHMFSEGYLLSNGRVDDPKFVYKTDV